MRPKVRSRLPRPTPVPPPSRGHGTGIVTLATMAVVAIAVTFPLYDPDIWQHLAVGRWTWEHQRLPDTHLWSWPTYGQPDAPPSWLFRVLLWPFAALDPVAGVQAWRWLTAVAAFGLAAAAARAQGARGRAVLPWVLLAACVLVYRGRSQARPETLVAVLLAAQLAVLEWWRVRPGWTLALVPVLTLLWGNAHLSGFLSPLVTLAYAIDTWRSRPPRPAALRTIAWTTLACAVAWLAHPHGAHAWLEPFQFLFSQRGEAVFQGIGELRPVVWSDHLRDGLPLLLVAVAAALLHRARTRGTDWAAVLIVTGATAVALSSQRFLGLWSVVAAWILARESGAWVEARTPGPRSATVRAGLALTALAAIAALAVTEPGRRFGVGLDPTRAPRAALEFMAARGIEGRGFAPFHFAGHLLWRFPEDRGRLPFMDIHQSGGAARRTGYVAAFTSAAGWSGLDASHRFDWVLLDRFQAPGDDLADRLDHDGGWALVFMDDAAALWVRRDGADSALARTRGLRLPAGQRNLAVFLADPSGWAEQAPSLRAECEALVAASTEHRQALALLALTALVAGDAGAARDAAERGLREYPGDPLLQRLAGAITGAR